MYKCNCQIHVRINIIVDQRLLSSVHTWRERLMSDAKLYSGIESVEIWNRDLFILLTRSRIFSLQYILIIRLNVNTILTAANLIVECFDSIHDQQKNKKQTPPTPTPPKKKNNPKKKPTKTTIVNSLCSNLVYNPVTMGMSFLKLLRHLTLYLYINVHIPALLFVITLY